MSSYERGHRGNYNGGRDREGDRRRYDESRDNRFKRSRDDSSGPRRDGKFQRGSRGGRGGRGGGRGMGKRQPKPEFVDLRVTKPKNAKKHVEPGSSDQIVKLCANYFKVSSINPVKMKMFNVEFEPIMENPKLRSILMSQISKNLGVHVYDDHNSIYFLHDPPKSTFKSRLRDGREFLIILKKCVEIDYTNANFLQILNLIINRSMKGMHLELIGKNYFDPNASISIPGEAIQMWPGFITSIRQYENDLLLCCDIAHKVIRDESILSILDTCKNSSRDDNSYRTIARKRLVGITVLTAYNNRTYKVHDIDFNSNPLVTFPFKDGEITFLDFYRQAYSLEIKNIRQPLLVTKPKARNIRGGKVKNIKLVPEFCYPTGISDEMRSDFRKMKDLADKTRLTPEQRVQRLLNFNGRIKNEETNTLRVNKLDLDDKLVEFDGRKLQDQKIIFGKNINGEPIVIDLKHVNNAADWTENLKNVTLFKPVKIKHWVCIFPDALSRQTEEFLNKFMEAGRNLGMKISNNVWKKPIINDNVDSYIQIINYYMAKDHNFMLIILPRMDAFRYGAIKKATFGDRYKLIHPPTTQIITLKTMEKKGGMSVATKVAIQVNCKLGGIPWMVHIPIKGLLAIGFSVTEDTKTSKEYYGAMVASMNPGKENGTFYSSVNKHSKGSTICEYFGVNVMKAVNKYIDEYKTLPEHIIIYRDGCSDGQIEYVLEQEVADVKFRLQKAYSQSEKPSEPKLAFVIINKRINTRIFSKQNNSVDNPLPGTVVDNVITLPERYDFYLISQRVTQGTVSPVSYNIIYDTFGCSAKEIQMLSYKLTHLYFNWSGTIRVPSVVQYAQKLAFLFGQHLHIDDNSVFEKQDADKQLYFL